MWLRAAALVLGGSLLGLAVNAARPGGVALLGYRAPASCSSGESPTELFPQQAAPLCGAPGMMMLSSQQGPKGMQSSGGYGGAGNSGPPPNGGAMPGIEQALKRETIEASTDTQGENVLSETRRQTERGQATVGFSHSAAVRSAPSAAEAAPPVPEGRRAAVQSYFTRKQ